MSDDKKATGQDRKEISLTEDYEVRDWTRSLGCTEDQLRKAVAAVGNSAAAVRDYLRKTS
ncbi:DUF3606 domain-containing protein [Xylophilus rhododendri]|uniref:DUF3606 domain-containing protein n=1 Tax=Xylophilus rhododendri TaxID=2697032 RepID=A0A857J8E5_9BURK|nr:DUF3606 domain-containing protein [Xylophilus rhododendri]QHJ00137.1 DUF3606 domain-containing protein [Xylophilus rhododendri]